MGYPVNCKKYSLDGVFATTELITTPSFQQFQTSFDEMKAIVHLIRCIQCGNALIIFSSDRLILIEILKSKYLILLYKTLIVDEDHEHLTSF